MEPCGEAAPLLNVVAPAACSGLPKRIAEKVCQHQAIETSSGDTLFQLLWELVEATLGEQNDGAIEILHSAMRSARS